jgi:hypothetical protein
MSDRKSRNFEANIPNYFPEDENKDICRYCDMEELQQMARERAVKECGKYYTDANFVSIYHEMYNKTGTCHSCYEDDMADRNERGF